MLVSTFSPISSFTQPVKSLYPAPIHYPWQQQLGQKDLYFGQASSAPSTAFAIKRPWLMGQSQQFPHLTIRTDFNNSTSNLEVAERFRQVFAYASHENHWLKKAFNSLLQAVGLRPSLADISNAYDNPLAAINTMALSLQCLGKAPNHNLYVAVCDPAVGNGNQDRAIFKTQHHGIYLGANNGTFGLLAKTLDALGEPYQVLPIDLKTVERFEQQRLNNPNYTLPPTFHGRDVFAVVAGAIAAGIAPEAFADTQRHMEVQYGSFASNIVAMPESPKKSVTPQAIYDATFGNVKISATLDPKQAEALVRDKALYQLSVSGKPIATVPFVNAYSDVDKNQWLAYLGSSPALQGNQRFVELAINLGNASQALNLNPSEAKAITLSRLT